MEKLTVVELRKQAKARGLKGYSKLVKKDLIALLVGGKSPVKRSTPKVKSPIKRRTRTRSRTRITEYQHLITPFLRPEFTFSPEAKAYFDKLFSELAIKLRNPKFVKTLGYLGEEAEERADRKEFTKIKIKGATTIRIGNILVYIAGELIDLINYGLINRKLKDVTVQLMDYIIRNDYDLSKAFGFS